jgi:hypothetical protein
MLRRSDVQTVKFDGGAHYDGRPVPQKLRFFGHPDRMPSE